MLAVPFWVDEDALLCDDRPKDDWDRIRERGNP